MTKKCSKYIYKTYISQYSGSQFTSKFDNYNVGKMWTCDILAAIFFFRSFLKYQSKRECFLIKIFFTKYPSKLIDNTN